MEFKSFPYLGIWSKENAPFICIEPWFNTADKVDSNGIFEENSVVFITDIDNNIIGKGITNYSSKDITNVIGKHSIEAKEILKSEKEEIVHANFLVLIEGENYGRIK